jgi:hypothetical protein
MPPSLATVFELRSPHASRINDFDFVFDDSGGSSR